MHRADLPPAVSAPRLRAEFVLLYLAAPLALIAAPDAIWTAIPIGVLVALGLLAVTAGFRWRELVAGPVLGDWRFLLGFSAATAVVCAGVMAALRPGAMLSLPRVNPELWLAVMLLYPPLSALPQEIIYRVLFFRRYGGLFPDRRVAIAVNAGVFGLAHAFLLNWPAVAMSVAGGAAFSVAYLGREGKPGGLWPAVILHGVAGAILFSFGLGVFFYHGLAR